MAHTAEEAETLLGLTDEEGEERPDLVLFDLDLSVKSGHDLLKEVKMHSELRRIRVVVLSSSEAEEDVIGSYDEHANAYVRKPVNREELTTIVQSIDEFWFQVVRLPDEGEYPSEIDPPLMLGRSNRLLCHIRRESISSRYRFF